MVLLLRHCHAGSRERWTEDDRERPLSAKGSRQAQLLAVQLARLGPQRIVSSPYRRCLQSVEPLASRLGLTVEESAALAEGGRAAEILTLARQAPGPTTVLCTHGDVVFAALQELVSEGARFADPGDRCEKGSVWVLESRPPGRIQARYQPPP